MRWRVREIPIRRGRKYALHASMVRPRRAKAKLTFAEAQATRMVAGKVRVMPNPAAGPLMAMMVGLQQLWMARVTRPPLFGYRQQYA